MYVLVLFLCLNGLCEDPLELPGFETLGNCTAARTSAIRWVSQARLQGARVGLMAYCRLEAPK